MSGDEFIVSASVEGHSVNLFRNGRHCVTFANGLTQENAEREARNLAALWRRISSDETSKVAQAIWVKHKKGPEEG